jgi:hypothetical protein
MNTVVTTTGATYRAWSKLPNNTIGSTVFSIGMCLRVPYFASVLPRVVALEPGRCEVTAPKWLGIRNHLGTFHAIAACNLAEATVPTSHRWIPKSMTVQYLTKATTSLRAVAELENIPDFATITDGCEIVVPVAIRDTAGIEVVHADITIWVSAVSR